MVGPNPYDNRLGHLVADHEQLEDESLAGGGPSVGPKAANLLDGVHTKLTAQHLEEPSQQPHIHLPQANQAVSVNSLFTGGATNKCNFKQLIRRDLATKTCRLIKHLS